MKNEARMVVAGSLLCVALLPAGRPQWLQQKMHPESFALRAMLSDVTEVRLVRGWDEAGFKAPLAALRGAEAQALADNLEFAGASGIFPFRKEAVSICLDPGFYTLRFYHRSGPANDCSYSFARNELGSEDIGHSLWFGYKTLTPGSKRALDAFLPEARRR